MIYFLLKVVEKERLSDRIPLTFPAFPCFKGLYRPLSFSLRGSLTLTAQCCLDYKSKSLVR